MAKAHSMFIGRPGVEVWVNYNTGTLRVTTIDWTLVTGVTARCQIWNNAVSTYDRTITGPASGNENVPGNIRLVMIDGVPEFPPSITWMISMRIT